MQMLRDLHNSLDMLITQPFPALACEQLRRFEDILDLSAVHAHVAESTQISLGDLVRQGALMVERFGFRFLFVCCCHFCCRAVKLFCCIWGGGVVVAVCDGFGFGGGEEGFGRAVAGGDLGEVVLGEEVLPDRFAGFGIEFLVVEADVDAALEGGVEGLDAVGGEELSHGVS